MNHGKYVFSRIVTILPARVFDRCVNQFNGDKLVKHFTFWNQLLCMMFGQLSNRDSLRDLLVCVNALKPKHYHLGFGKGIPRSNLSEANENDDRYRLSQGYRSSKNIQNEFSTFRKYLRNYYLCHLSCFAFSPSF